VVVGVEELAEVHGIHTASTTCHGKVEIEASEVLEAGRGQAQQEGGVQNLVVEGAIDSNPGDACICLQLPVLGLGGVGHVDELSLGQLAGPILLEGDLHLALAANAGETCGRHATAKGSGTIQGISRTVTALAGINCKPFAKTRHHEDRATDWQCHSAVAGGSCPRQLCCPSDMKGANASTVDAAALDVT
jgi:hypothetical protein